MKIWKILLKNSITNKNLKLVENKTKNSLNQQIAKMITTKIKIN